jgi:radical SAM family uncharacterized protein/radical SAM-linked protein
MTDRTPLSEATLALLLDGVDQPARYVGGEPNAIVKPEARRRLALCFPDVYEVAESHVGLKILYDIVNANPDWAAERVYALWPDMESRARAQGVPLWSLETRTPLFAFDVIGFTLQYELTYPTLLAMLDHGRIPIESRARSDTDPIVIAGGGGACNPEPLADFIDAFLIGDGEEAIAEILAAIAANRDASASRAELLAALAEVPGIYVPAHLDVIYAGLTVASMRPRPGTPGSRQRTRHGTPRYTRRTVVDLDATPYPTRAIVPNVQPVHDRVVVEIQRGCSRGCRFCQAGMTTRPTRQRRPETVLRLADEGLAATGCDVVSLLSLSAGDYGPMNDVLETFFTRYQDERIAISLPSLRTESMSSALADQVARVRKSSFTLAPEAGSERLRQVINKTNSEADLLAAVRAAMAAGWRALKLYFMIGLPSETDADVDAIARLAFRALAEGRAERPDARVTVAVSTFVPKPHTPLQWEAQISLEETRRKHRLLREALRSNRIDLRWHSPEQSFVEGVLARGDRRLGVALAAVMRAGGRLDGWSEHYDHARWLTALTAALAPHGLAPGDYLGARDPAATLPWDHIDVGVLKKFLKAERNRARRNATVEDCVLADRCTACGACDLADPYLVADATTGARVIRLAPRLSPPLEQRPPVSERRSPAAQSRVARSRLRFRFAKLGPAVHFSHLDTSALIIRAVRRSHLPVLYSEGHSPHPRIGFSPACPTGMTSEAEYFEVECLGFPSPARYLAALNALLPAGFVVREGVELDYGAPALNELLAATTYRVSLADGVAVDAPGVAAFHARAACPVRVVRKGRPKLLDARLCLRQVEVRDGQLWVTIAAARSGTIKVGEAVALLLGEPAARQARFHKEAVTLATTPLGHDPAPEVGGDRPAVDLSAFSERRTAESPGRAELRPPFAED